MSLYLKSKIEFEKRDFLKQKFYKKFTNNFVAKNKSHKSSLSKEKIPLKY